MHTGFDFEYFCLIVQCKYENSNFCNVIFNQFKAQFRLTYAYIQWNFAQTKFAKKPTWFSRLPALLLEPSTTEVKASTQRKIYMLTVQTVCVLLNANRRKLNLYLSLYACTGFASIIYFRHTRRNKTKISR